MKPNIFQENYEKEVLANQAKIASRIEGDFAEVGVYMGRSAEIIKQNAPNKRLHLFDTFTGLPDMVLPEDEKHYLKPGDMAVDFKAVKDYLKKYDNIFINRGIFTGKEAKDNRFAFVHIDVDIYHSTKTVIEFFYQRMNKDGIMLIHDYPIHSGVRRAIDEFLKDKQVNLVQSGSRQLIITKL